MLLGGHTQLVVECVVPDLLHIVPAGGNAVFNGVFQDQDASLALNLIAQVAVLLTHTHYHTLVPRAAHHGGKDGLGGIVACEACLAHAGAIVDDQLSGIVIHGELVAGVDGRQRSC